MKCQCERCRGEGTIACPDCSGDGQIDLARHCTPEVKAELKEIERVARRVRWQADQLSALLPQHAGKYREQCASIQAELTAEAKEILRK